MKKGLDSNWFSILKQRVFENRTSFSGFLKDTAILIHNIKKYGYCKCPVFI